MFPFLIGKVLTIPYKTYNTDEIECNIVFPFLIGKVLTIRKFPERQRPLERRFPFLIGKVLTLVSEITRITHANEKCIVSIPYR